MLTINTKAIVGWVGRIGLVRVLVAKGILNFEF